METSYAEQWRDLRQRRRILWLFALAYLPGAGAMFLFALWLVWLIGLSARWVDGAFLIIGGLWLTGILGASYHAMAFLCPRCH
jgi:hypothetical protein